METGLVLIIAVFAITALMECFCGFASVRAALSQNGERTLILIPVSGHMGDIEYVLRQAAEMAGRVDMPCRCVICDMGADGETLEICRRFAEEFWFEIEEREDDG